MPQSYYFLAHELRTTGNQVTLLDVTSGTVVTTGIAYPHPNWAERDAADW